jgi:hypothetical protein
MIPIIHRINDPQELKIINPTYGVEIDVRMDNNKLILAHDLNKSFFDFSDFTECYNHSLLVVNIKESGIEDIVINELAKRKISNFFLLDIEFPYLYKHYQSIGNLLSIRFSKLESIESAKYFSNKVDWLWVDTYDEFPISDEISKVMKNFKIILVSPSRWGDSDLLDSYLKLLNAHDLQPYGVMVANGEENKLLNFNK